MQYIDEVVLEKEMDTKLIQNFARLGEIKVPITKDFSKKPIDSIGEATVYEVGKEVHGMLAFNELYLKDVDGYTPAIGGILDLKKKEAGKRCFKITEVALCKNGNSDRNIKPLKDISKLILKGGDLIVSRLEGLSYEKRSVPTYFFKKAAEAKALFEFDNIRTLSAADGMGSISLWKHTKGRTIQGAVYRYLNLEAEIKVKGFTPELEKWLDKYLKWIQ